MHVRIRIEVSLSRIPGLPVAIQSHPVQRSWEVRNKKIVGLPGCSLDSSAQDEANLVLCKGPLVKIVSCVSIGFT